jgi:peptide/nickel transport system substrate-binding protein
MKFFKKMLFLTAMMVLTTGLIFAGGRSQQTSAGVTFTVALSGDIRAVDPGLAWDYTTNQVTNQITEGLVTLDANNNIVPELARSWSQQDDLTYVYNVRDDIVFSDGSKMTMDDVLFSFERARDPEGGTYFSDFYEEVDSFTVNGWQFIIKLKQPSAVFKYVPATGAGRIISKAYYQKQGQDNFGSASGGIIATGPFVYQSWTSGQEVTLKKNTNYWNKEKLAANIVDTLIFRIIPDDTTRVAALQRGDVDFSVNIPTDMLDQLSSQRDLALTSVDSFHLTYLALNTQRPPMNDINVRKAISRALNIPEFQRNIIKGAGSAGTVLPFGSSLYNENAAGWQNYLRNTQGYTFDLAAARQYLARSAYPNGFNADLIVNRQNSLALQRALYIQEALKAININVNVIGLTGGEQDEYHVGNARDARGYRDYDMLIGGWEADYPDFDCNIRIMYVASQGEAGGYNAAAYGTPQVESLIAAQRATIDPAKRFQLQTQLMDIIVEDVPYIIFDYSLRYSVLNRKYTGVSISPAWLWTVPIQNIRRAN